MDLEEGISLGFGLAAAGLSRYLVVVQDEDGEGHYVKRVQQCAKIRSVVRGVAKGKKRILAILASGVYKKGARLYVFPCGISRSNSYWQ